VTAHGISLVGVRKWFGPTRALDGASFHASLGEIHAVVGGNGCGKSTLAKVMSGVLPIDSGQVSVLGHAPSTPHEARALGIATVFQEVLVADECSVTENLFLGSDALFSRSRSAAEKAEATLAMMRDLTGTEIDPQTLVGTLPLNLKQWIVIGRALLQKPKVLILDESSAALDFDSTQRLFTKMRELRAAGSAIVIVTHRIAELIQISDRATVLRDGRDVGVLEKRDITERNLLSLMTGRADAGTKHHGSGPDASGAPVVMRAEQISLWPGAQPVNVELRRGEILGLAGLDGMGQTEFARVLAGVDRPVAGRTVIRPAHGEPVAVEGLAQAQAQRIAYVSGDRKREGIFANLSIFENLLMPLYRRTARAGFLGVIDWAALGGVFDWEAEKLSVRMGDRGNKITSLSGGNQQKVLIGRAFALNPDVLVLGDPARGIDVGAKAELYRHLRDYAESGKSVVYMSSEIEEFVGFASRVLVFRHGTVFEEFAGAAIDPARILESMFGQTRSARRAQTAVATHSPATMKIIDFDAQNPQRRAEEQIMHIKVVDFGDDGFAPVDAAAPPATRRVPLIKIVDFDAQARERDARQSVGRIKVVETDRPAQAPATGPEPGSAAARGIKVVEFDGQGRARQR
jgi:ribose transport system ATP-binding protein